MLFPIEQLLQRDAVRCAALKSATDYMFRGADFYVYLIHSSSLLHIVSLGKDGIALSQDRLE